MPRKALDGAKLAADVSKLESEDKISPPTAQPSLMDAVRALASYIETRAKLGWTDPMIAVLLTKAGYPISAGTLCSYRKRLRDEGLMAPLPAGGQKNRTQPPAANTVTTAQLPTTVATASASDPVELTAAVPAPLPPATAAADESASARAPPDSDSTPTPSPARTFRVDRTKLPPDRA